MNLYIFNEVDTAAVYGIGTYIRELVQALKNSDMKIHVVGLRAINDKFEIKTIDNIDYWLVPDVKSENPVDLKSEKSIDEIELYYHNVIFLLRLHIKDQRNLIFQINYNQSYALAKGLKETFDCKVITVLHYIKWELLLLGNLAKFNNIKNKHESKRSQFEQIICTTDEYEYSLFDISDHIVALSQDTYSILCKEYHIAPEKILIIPNGLSDISLNSNNGKQCFRNNWMLPGSEKLILFVGRLEEEKGLIFLIRAFRKVLQTMPDCRLIIAGNGNFDLFMQETNDICIQVTFVGLLEKKKLYELFSMADIGVMPSFHEQCSYVAIEMMMHGLPLIANAFTGLEEMIEDNVSGLHIPVIQRVDSVEIDVDLLSQKMLYLLQNPEERKRMSKNARKRYEKYYSLEVFREQMVRFYQSLF